MSPHEAEPQRETGGQPVVELNEANFDEVVTDAQGPVLVDFWGKGCGPCLAMERVLQQVAARHPEVRLAKLDVGALPNVAWAFDVLSVPTVVLFEGGVPTQRVVGAVPAQRIEQLLGS